MSIFWKYFKNTCQWIYIQQPGPIPAIVEGGSFLLDTTRESILWLRDQFNPATSETDFAGKHSESRNIKTLPGETEEQFFNRIIYALLWYRRAGKKPGMKDNFEVVGWPDAEIINCRDEDPERWAEFRLDLNASGKTITPESIKTIVEVTNDQKPARSKLASIGLNSSLTRNDYFAGMMLTARKSELMADNPMIYQDSFLVDGAIVGSSPPTNKHNPTALYTGRGVSVSGGRCVVSKNKYGNGIFVDIGSEGVETARRMTFDFALFYSSSIQMNLETWIMIGHNEPIYSIYDGGVWFQIGTNMIVQWIGNGYTIVNVATGISSMGSTPVINVDILPDTHEVIFYVNGNQKATFGISLSSVDDRVCGFVNTYEYVNIELNEMKIEAI